ncbi:glucokinase [Fodinicurvata halophila]|uniref:glucokinase n=1 Tax=Fodinicurvata halophila TaxID=1419723 RepID=UPI003640B3E1
MHRQVVEAREDLDFLSALKSFLKEAGDRALVATALAVAAPIRGRVIQMTNRGWRIDIPALERYLSGSELLLLNDFTAQVLALPVLGAESCRALNDRPVHDQSARVLLGPGTGLGMAGLLPLGGGRWRPVVGEGGHMTQAALEDSQADVLARVRRRFGHASVERVVSGAGLVVLFQAVAEGEGKTVPDLSPSDVVARAAKEQCPLAQAAVGFFTDFLAISAGNAALAFGAFGGLYLTGGVLRHLGPLFDEQRFRRIFADKGRFADYLEDVPLFRVVQRDPAFTGLLNLLSLPEEERVACAAYRKSRSP